MNILVLNCGSSSVKYQLLVMKSETENEVLAQGLVERIGLPDGILTHKPSGKDKYKVTQAIPDHTVGINLIIGALTDKEHGVISSVKEIDAVGHRVAHGGESFKESVLIDEEVKKGITKLFELAPLHNPAHMKGIEAMEAILPNVPQTAVFDTSFHQTMPAKAFLYAIPYKFYQKYGIRRYGFHGTSHKFVAEKACRITGLKFEESKIVTCHLGNGASITAIDKGSSIDTSMGFTPVDGLMMGTRSGSVDPGVLLFLADKEKLDIKGVSDLINKESGVKGVTEISSDMRDVEMAAEDGNDRAQLALNMYYYRILKFIGSYAAAMGGVDMIVFTGGVGENDPILREFIGKKLGFLGVDFDEEANKGVRGKDKVLTKDGSKVKVMVCTTNEELVIATDTMHIINTKK